MANTTTTNSTLPDYISGPSKGALGDINSWLKSGSNYVYGSKPGESLYTPLTANQNKAIGNTSWLADQDLAEMFGINKAGGLLDKFANFQPGKLTDEGGYLGKISDDVNPYLQQVLDPQIREINNSLQSGRRDLDASQQMAGAFGDARHGVVESGLYDKASENIADVTGRAHADAWNTAMGLRASDRDAAVHQNDNLATAASGVAGLGQQKLKNFTDVNDALFNAGTVQRDANEERRSKLQQFQEAIKGKKYDDAIKMLGAINGTPYPSSSVQETKSNDGLMGILGALAGAL